MTLASGTLADLNLSSIAAVTSLGRSSLRLELREPDGTLIGHLVLKAGRVVSATAGTRHGHEALHVLMGSSSDAHFRLDREPLDFVLSAALASVDELQELGRPTSRRMHRPPTINGDRTGPRRAPNGTHAHSLLTRDRKITRPAARILMMEGRLDEFDLLMLLQALGVGRQLVELEIRDRDGAPLGAIVVKSGKVISAHASETFGVGAIWELFTSPTSFQFAAFRITGDIRPDQELASISEVIVSLMRQSAEPRDRVVVEGSLSEFDIPTLLQTLGCGRQYCALEIHDELTAIGTIFLKSGVVLSATSGELTGVPALQQLLATPTTARFRLLRLVSQVPDAPPLGPVHHVLMRLATAEPADPEAAPSRPTVPAYPQLPQPVDAPADPAAPARIAAPAAAEPVLMEGNLAEFDVRTVLEVLSSTRQHARMQILGSGNALLGEIALKSGRVLSAHAGSLVGPPALRFLVGVSRQLQFRVLTGTQDLASAQPLGSVGELLTDVQRHRPETQSHRPETQSHRPEVPGHRTPPVESSRRLLRWAIPISFVVGGAVAFFVARGAHRAPPATAIAPAAPHDAPVVTMPVVPPTAAITKAAAPTPEPPRAEVAASQPPRAAIAPAPPTADTTASTPRAAAAVRPLTPTPPAAGAPPPAPLAAVPAQPRRDEVAARQGMSIRNAQLALRRLGYDPGPIDNRYGRLTRLGLMQFQRSQRLPVTGMLDQETWSAMVAQLVRN